MSQTDVLEECHTFNKGMYRRDPRNKEKFITRHWDDIQFYPATPISEECSRIFTERVRYYTRHPKEMSDEARTETLLNVVRTLRRIDPEMLAKIVGAPPESLSNRDMASRLDLNLDHATPEFADIILSAFHDSGRFRGMVYNEPGLKKFFADVADKEKRLIIADSLYAQGEKEQTNFVMVIGDMRHAEKTAQVIEDEVTGGGYSRKGRSFVMLPEDFVASCKAIHARLSKVARKTDSLRAELDALGEALGKAKTEFDGDVQKDYCQMSLNNRYKEWGISIQRY
jgi:hypothetical protein